MNGFLNNGNKTQCFGCEACAQVCGKKAIAIVEDEEGFRYPQIDKSSCVECGLCNKVCPYENMPTRYGEDKYAFGGYIEDEDIRFNSTSGGAFSAVVEAFCDENYVIFGAEADGLKVLHDYITNNNELQRFRKSKYSQSEIGNCYIEAKRFLKEGRKVLFSGTPCQIAGLKSFLGACNQDKLLTVEVVCEGVPSPLYVRKLEKHFEKKYGCKIESLDYRYTGKALFSEGKWDFEQMRVDLGKVKKSLKKDRWFNPFWSIWLKHLMSRPSCYECPFANTERVADISLGDLWGVHIYCPELYGRNGGASLVVCNTKKGKKMFEKAKPLMYGHELSFEDALRYQGPMRKHIAYNPRREEFMDDLRSDMPYNVLKRKWADKPSLKLLFQKYIWGNRQKVFVWNIKTREK